MPTHQTNTVITKFGALVSISPIQQTNNSQTIKRTDTRKLAL